MTRRALLGCLGAGLAGAGLLWRHRPTRWRPGFTVHLLPPEGPDAGEQRMALGLQWVLRAHLATLAPACVVAVPRTDLLLPAHRRAFELQLRPERRGDLLNLGFRWRPAGGAWTEVPGTPAVPVQALSALLAKLPEAVEPDREARLLPSSPWMAWELFELASNRGSFSQTPALRPRLERLTALAPGCALAWCLLGRAAHQEMLERQDWTAEDRALAESSLGRAQELLPGLPFAAGELSQMLSDFGENGPALKVLARAIRIHPNSEMLLRRLAYSARNAGLLELAHRALLRLEGWIGYLGGIENTLLYLGETGRFEEWLLAEAQGTGWTAPHRFYFGYSALLRGDRTEALRRLRKAGGQWSEARFGRIGFALWTFLEGRARESMETLEELARQHLSLRTPDGEFILKLAELMALHGEGHRALDLAVRAASHGFGCVNWYEESPLLAPIRGLLRYQALLHSLRERRAAHAERFPPSAFGF